MITDRRLAPHTTPQRYFRVYQSCGIGTRIPPHMCLCLALVPLLLWASAGRRPVSFRRGHDVFSPRLPENSAETMSWCRCLGAGLHSTKMKQNICKCSKYVEARQQSLAYQKKGDRADQYITQKMNHSWWSYLSLGLDDHTKA